jgi:transcriptional regulator with XRE-family HTH domain
MGLGTNVGALVKARGLSYAKVAKDIGTDTQAVWALVKRKSSKSALAVKLADYFKVPLTRLMAEDFDVKEVPAPQEFPLEEREAMTRLRKALPEWRLYVIGLAMVDNHQTQKILLDTMRQAVPDRRVEEFVQIAPHAAARKKREREPR